MSTDYSTRLRQFVCGLQGHETLLQFGRGRLSLRCVSCGHETPGWDIKTRATGHDTEPAPPRRRWRLLPHLAGARRMA